MRKATAVAHTIQGLMKYHGLKDKKRRIPYHDSISVCVEALTTTATIEYGNTHPEFVDEVCREIRASTNLGVIKSGVGGPARTFEGHLF